MMEKCHHNIRQEPEENIGQQQHAHFLFVLDGCLRCELVHFGRRMCNIIESCSIVSTGIVSIRIGMMNNSCKYWWKIDIDYIRTFVEFNILRTLTNTPNMKMCLE